MISSRGEASGFAPREAHDDRLVAVRAIAELRHPHVVPIRPGPNGGFEFDEKEGRSLAELLASRGGPLPLRVSLRILLDALSGLSALHRAKLGGKPLDFVHGEVMPANIIVGRDGVARIVPLVTAHWLPGSPPSTESIGYTAPEKLLGDAFDQRADVFSVGVLLWEAMAGRSLFHDLPVDDVVTQLVGGKVRPPAASDAPWSAELADVAMRALAVDPSDRWEHIGIMGADIETIALGHIAKSSELIALVTGRQVSRDSMSDEVTMPLASVSSLSPISNSIPATSDDSVTRRMTPEPPPSDSTVPIETPALRAPRDPMPERLRFKIVAASLGVSLVLLALAGYKKMSNTSDGPTATVLAPAAQAVEPPTEATNESPTQEAIEIAPRTLEPAVPTISAPAAPDTRAGGSVPKGTAQSSKARPNEAKSDGKAKGDPFGLMKPVKMKPKADPFGL
jgi:serine/threonine protein kinase